MGYHPTDLPAWCMDPETPDEIEAQAEYEIAEEIRQDAINKLADLFRWELQNSRRDTELAYEQFIDFLAGRDVVEAALAKARTK